MGCKLRFVPPYVGGSKGKAAIKLKYIPEKIETFDIHLGKAMHVIDGQIFDPKVLLFQPTMQCHSYMQGFIYKVLPEYGR